MNSPRIRQTFDRFNIFGMSFIEESDVPINPSPSYVAGTGMTVFTGCPYATLRQLTTATFTGASRNEQRAPLQHRSANITRRCLVHFQLMVWTCSMLNGLGCLSWIPAHLLGVQLLNLWFWITLLKCFLCYWIISWFDSLFNCNACIFNVYFALVSICLQNLSRMFAQLSNSN